MSDAPLGELASMRPPEFTGGNHQQEAQGGPQKASAASMRPPEFTGGNPWTARDATVDQMLQ